MVHTFDLFVNLYELVGAYNLTTSIYTNWSMYTT